MAIGILFVMIMNIVLLGYLSTKEPIESMRFSIYTMIAVDILFAIMVLAVS